MFAEGGVGLFRGKDFPFAGSDTGHMAKSAYARTGNNIGFNQSFRVGAYVLDGSAMDRGVVHAHGGPNPPAEHGHDVESDHDDGQPANADMHDEHGDPHDMHGAETEGDHGDDGSDPEHGAEQGGHDLLADGVFTGDTTLYSVHVRYTWAPAGSLSEQEFTLQGEFIWRAERGIYSNEEGEMAAVDGTSSGWYLQGAYKFNPVLRAGLRYSRLNPVSSPDPAGEVYDAEHHPNTMSVMTDRTRSKYGRVRLQFNRESLNREEADNQLYLQYILVLGSHGSRAH